MFKLRTFFLSLIILVGMVAVLVQAVVAGYDRQFSPPGPLHAWQLREQAGGGEVVTVWGQSFSLRADELSAAADSACTYIDHLPEVRELLGGVVRIPAVDRTNPPDSGVQGAAGDRQ